MSSAINYNSANTEESLNQAAKPWKGWVKYLFRTSFVFFVILSIPLSIAWYKALFSIDWLSVHYRDIYDIARFSPSFGIPRAYSLGGYADWFVTLFIALIGAAIWSLLDKNRKEYNTLYYWLRVIIRYRAGIGIIGFGFTKLLPVQMPYPSLGLLNTDFGDFTSQKIYWLSIGIVPWYQVFAGIVECTAGAFLFFRKTTTLGAILLFGALGDIVFVNFSYDGGVHVYSSYFVLYAAFLLIQDTPKIWNLIVLEKFTIPVHFYPTFSEKWLKNTRIALKTLTIFIFLILLFYVQLINFIYEPYKQPALAGVKELRGNYDVAEFRINNKIIPYSPLDTVRWQQATFENWTSFTFKVNKPVKLDLSNGGGAAMRDINRTFELTGTAGGQRVFYYEVDTANKVLYLKDKNTAALKGNRMEGGERIDAAKNKKGDKKDKKPKQKYFLTEEQEYAAIGDLALTTRRKRGIKKERSLESSERKSMVLNYKTDDGSQIILTGINENKDSIYVVLNRVNRNYTLSKSTLNAGKY